MMTTVTVSMPESLKLFLDSEVETRGYGNVSEYIRTLLRDAQARRDDKRLEELLLEGLAEGKRIPINADFWKKLRADAAQIASEYRKTKNR